MAAAVYVQRDRVVLRNALGAGGLPEVGYGVGVRTDETGFAAFAEVASRVLERVASGAISLPPAEQLPSANAGGF